MDRLEMEADNLYSKAKKYEMAAKALAGLRERLTSNVKHLMQANELTQLRGMDETFTLSKGKPSVEITNLSLIPRTFLVVTVTEKPDKEKLYEKLSIGEPISGCELRPTTRLSRKINKT